MSKQKNTPGLGSTGGRNKKQPNTSIPQNAITSKAFYKAVKDTKAEAGSVIDGIVTMKVYYEAGAILRHSVTVTKKYRRQGS
ncbi:hypothetical protein AGMMS49587_16650 [Spirochaetia bacterium]|nr:hypothetical protein AGMMS49587_16650 [Spirochaetia bacterium]